MRPARSPIVDVVIPALDEAGSIGRVLADLPRGIVRAVVVADNGSIDATARIAADHGAFVVHEPRRGYGSACLAALDHVLTSDPPPDIVVFLDGDYSDDPTELPAVVSPILADRADLVIGSRTLGRRESGALLPQARVGNAVAAGLIRLLYGIRVTDLGPFRAIRRDALLDLAMQDRDFGWTAEMQVKAARRGLRVVEVPVSYRRRIGRSKITGTVTGSARAATKILWTILRYST